MKQELKRDGGEARVGSWGGEIKEEERAVVFQQSQQPVHREPEELKELVREKVREAICG